ncbi:MAG: TRAP transporter substrate-binding protein [Alphaproteobacteria bacterium]|nr:TRAP transporter substrate-binding protein [Alphaproteobacteria bacterium]
MVFGRFVAGASLAAAVALAPLAVSAQDKKVHLNIQSNFASTLQILGPNAHFLVDTIKTISGGSIDAKFFEPGAMVPPGQSFDAVASGSLDAAWATPGYWTGKDIAFAVYSTVPFGPDTGEYMAWMKFGGGEKMLQALYAKYGIHSIICHVIAPEASGWFRKEIKTLDDLKGLKMRFFGLGANVMQKLGVATQLLQAGEIFQALQLGTIDATEFSMPAMDLSLGFYQVAKYYYFPGWHQQSTFGDLIINKKKWDSMSKTQQAQIQTACDATTLRGIGLSEYAQADAMQELKAKGVNFMTWNKTFLDAYKKAWVEVAKEQADKSPEFKKAWDSLTAFRAKYEPWRERGYLRD